MFLKQSLIETQLLNEAKCTQNGHISYLKLETSKLVAWSEYPYTSISICLIQWCYSKSSKKESLDLHIQMFAHKLGESLHCLHNLSDDLMCSSSWLHSERAYFWMDNSLLPLGSVQIVVFENFPDAYFPDIFLTFQTHKDPRALEISTSTLQI